MKRLIWIYGVLAGLICIGWAIGFMAVGNQNHFENGMYYGYASMIIAFSMIFVAVKKYRDEFNNGVISFGKAFTIGLQITLIASTVYVVVWLIYYFTINNDFLDKYLEFAVNKMKAENTSQEEITKFYTEFNQMKEYYKNPFFNALITYTEILPVGLIISLICAGIFKRKANYN